MNKYKKKKKKKRKKVTYLAFERNFSPTAFKNFWYSVFFYFQFVFFVKYYIGYFYFIKSSSSIRNSFLFLFI